MNQLYTVGQVAAICNVSIQGLHYYDKIGLLKPAIQNQNNGYRYYTNREIRMLRIMQDMKKMGFSLEEIQRIIQIEDRTHLFQLLNEKKREVERIMDEYQQTLDIINRRIENYSLSIHDTYFSENSVEIKQIPDRMVYYKRYYSSGVHEELILRFYELDKNGDLEGVKPEGFRMAIYHDFLLNFDINRCDLEVCNEILSGYVYQKQDNIRIIPGGVYATVLYSGPYQGQCTVLANWLDKHNYIITGPGIEIYNNSFMNTIFPKNYVTEIQFPIKEK